MEKITWKTETRTLKELKPWAHNPRHATQKQCDDLDRSLEKFGEACPIIINIDNTIIGGHFRRNRLLEKHDGNYIVDVRVPCRELNTADISELNIRLNANTGSFDYDILANEFEYDNLIDWGLDLPDFKPTEEPPGPGDPDAIPEDVETKCKTGDLWQLGEHRLLCGDCTDEANVARLMDGAKADMVFTDPPYGMDAVKNSGVLKKKYKNIEGDNSTEVAIRAFTVINKDIPAVWWGANYYANVLPNSSCWLVWDKNNGGSDQMDCELAWTNLKGVTRQFTQASEKKNRVHPTQKLVELVEWCFAMIPADYIFDPFLGSGTTLIACEKTGRKCYGMEIDEHYCDVIIKRWEDYTDNKAVKL